MTESIKSGQAKAPIANLMQEVLRLVEASKNGQLRERANVAAFGGEDAKFCAASTRCSTHSAADRRGQPHPRPDRQGQDRRTIAQTYQGDHEKMKVNVNGIAHGAAEVPGGIRPVDRIPREGKLEKRANAAASRATTARSSRASTTRSTPSCGRSARATASSTRSQRGRSMNWSPIPTRAITRR